MLRKDSDTSQQSDAISTLLQLVQPPPDATPTFAKQEPVPILSHWSCNVFTFSHALWPALVQLAYSKFYDGQSLPFAATLLLYTAAYLNMIARAGTALVNLGAE